MGSNEAEYLEVIVGFEDRWEIHDGMDGGMGCFMMCSFDEFMTYEALRIARL